MLKYMYRISQRIGFVCADATRIDDTAVMAMGFKHFDEYKQAYKRHIDTFYHAEIADPRLYFSMLSNRLDSEMFVPVWPVLEDALECRWLSDMDKRKLWFCVDWDEKRWKTNALSNIV